VLSRNRHNTVETSGSSLSL